MDGFNINIASFEDGIVLKSAIFKAAADSGMDISQLDEMEIMDALKAAVSVDTSKEVYDAIWPCLARCTYKNERITKATFEPAEMREFFYPVAIECIKVNLSPFLKRLLSGLNTNSSLGIINILKSKLETK